VRSRASSTRAVFGDTSAFFALAAQTDRYHAEAQALLERVTSEHRLLYTTNFILAVTHALLLHRLKPTRGAPYARATALLTVDRLYRGAQQLGTLIHVTPADEAKAFAMLGRFTDKDFTFTDATSFAVMARLGLTLAFSFDEDFVRAGFARFI
jgi:uncharacterized protein